MRWILQSTIRSVCYWGNVRPPKVTYLWKSHLNLPANYIWTHTIASHNYKKWMWRNHKSTATITVHPVSGLPSEDVTKTQSQGQQTHYVLYKFIPHTARTYIIVIGHPYTFTWHHTHTCNPIHYLYENALVNVIWAEIRIPPLEATLCIESHISCSSRKVATIAHDCLS